MRERRDLLKNPRLNRIFRKAYHATMKDVEIREKHKSIQDYIEAHVELFEQGLFGRDLSAEEQRAFVDAFRRKMMQAESRRNKSRKTSRRLLLTAGGSLTFAVLFGFVLYVGIRRPFMPLPQVEANLQHYLEKVDTGFGSFSKKYYALLRRQDRRLGPVRADRYNQDMYRELDEHFQELLVKLRNGELVYLDDARRWADYFPEPGERKARKKLATNAIVGGVGESIGDAVKSILDGAIDVIDRTIDAIDND